MNHKRYNTMKYMAFCVGEKWELCSMPQKHALSISVD